MRRYLLATALVGLSPMAMAGDCVLPPLKSQALPYQEGRGLPVIAGPYQFGLPEQPTALLAFDGVMAVLPGKHYVSYQLISDQHIPEMLAQFTTHPVSTAAVDRYLYGITPLDALNAQDQKLITGMRSDLQLDCHARLTLYSIGNGAEVVLQEPTSTNPEYRMLFFAGESTHLVSVKGSKAQAFSVLQSIKRRT